MISLNANDLISKDILGVSDSFDAFGRLRVAQHTTLGDLKQTRDALPLLLDRVVGGTGLSTYNTGESSSTLTTAASGDYVIVQTKQRFLYQSGKGTPYALTLYDFGTQANITKRIGCFQSSTTAPYTASLSGIFLENANGVLSVQSWRNGTQTNYVAQTDWFDKLDGTGASGIAVDWTKNQILEIDYQWLGVGWLRFGINVRGVIHYFCIIENANKNQKVYMASPNQPIRYEIRQTGAGSGTFTHICASVGIEGAINLVGTQKSIVNSNTAISFPNVGTKYAALGIRLQSTLPNAVIDIINAEVLCTIASTFYRWDIILNPTVAGTFTYANVTDSSIQSASGVASNTVTGGTILSSGFGSLQAVSGHAIDEVIRLGVSIAGIQDTIVLTITPATVSGTYLAIINFVEYS